MSVPNDDIDHQNTSTVGHRYHRDRRKHRSGEKIFHHVPHVSQGHVTSSRNFVEMSNISEAQTNKIVHNSSQDNSLHDFYPVLVNHRPRARTLERGKYIFLFLSKQTKENNFLLFEKTHFANCCAKLKFIFFYWISIKILATSSPLV